MHWWSSESRYLSHTRPAPFVFGVGIGIGIGIDILYSHIYNRSLNSIPMQIPIQKRRMQKLLQGNKSA